MRLGWARSNCVAAACTSAARAIDKSADEATVDKMIEGLRHPGEAVISPDAMANSRWVFPVTFPAIWTL